MIQESSSHTAVSIEVNVQVKVILTVEDVPAHRTDRLPVGRWNEEKLFIISKIAKILCVKVNTTIIENIKMVIHYKYMMYSHEYDTAYSVLNRNDTAISMLIIRVKTNLSEC